MATKETAAAKDLPAKDLPLVAGIDGSDASLCALDWAVDEARRHGARLRVVYASLWERYEGRIADQDSALTAEALAEERVVALAQRRALERAPGLEVAAEVVPDEAVNALLAEAYDAAALVIGPSGHTTLAGLLLGSVSLTVAGRAHCPVIVVRGEQPAVQGEHRRIVVGVGDPAEAPAALRFALREGAARGCEVAAVRAWRHPARQSVEHYPLPSDATVSREEAAARELSDLLREPHEEFPEVVVRPTTLEGPAHRLLVEHSRTADLLVVGATRRHRALGFQLGRVSHTALHRAACPVAVVPHH
ncbi:universal stress protein [Streptomyces orinoci]|uniref:Universal stress protein n=1 Tax=Streptomyces orinoci TaxID=67339 RepID=A0ABV3JR23_STRON|nr:universal stress protein [Streptomyces orinoci]